MSLKCYRTIDIAREAEVHVNTVRLYEAIGLISAVPRATNGYRIFSEKHLYQTKIVRLIHHGIWPGKTIRNSGMKIISAMKEWDLNSVHKYAGDYIKTINEERQKALDAINTLENWGKNIYASSSGDTYNRKQTADIIGTSPEVLRNWERRGLITVPQKSNRRAYSLLEIERLRVIYIMLQSNYKISEISERLNLYDKETINENPNDVIVKIEEHILSLHSHWLKISDNILGNAMKILDVLNEIS